MPDYLEALSLLKRPFLATVYVAGGTGYASRPRSQCTFLSNHVGQIVAAVFFVVPTVTCRLVFVLVLLAQDRRRIRHVAVTAHPTAAWTALQLREAFPVGRGAAVSGP